MAEKDQFSLAEYIKGVHLALRKSTLEFGAEKAWKNHCKNIKVLTIYSKCMQTLATVHWEVNSNKENKEVISRIKWTNDFCIEYFVEKLHQKYSQRDMDIANKIDVSIENGECFYSPLKLLDVGSCYNPFRLFELYDVLALDLCPANETVLQCDFLQVPVKQDILLDNTKILQLPACTFEVVTFCFVLEYIPTSEQRIQACKKAYTVLKFGGLLIICTPDSKHVGANCKLMKCWQYTLSLMGFTRIKYEKFKHMHCMAYRKSLHKDIAVRWATIHKKPYMEFSINIPQDFSVLVDAPPELPKGSSSYNFDELPFCNI